MFKIFIFYIEITIILTLENRVNKANFMNIILYIIESMVTINVQRNFINENFYLRNGFFFSKCINWDKNNNKYYIIETCVKAHGK